jgi:hypothetical protein
MFEPRSQDEIFRSVGYISIRRNDACLIRS